MLGIGRERLKKYPQVRAAIKAAVDQPTLEQDEVAIRQAFACLAEHDLPVTLRRISMISQVPYWRLANYPLW
jgi:hypothetical protein